MRGDHKDSERTDRHSSRVASAASPVQKSPNTPTPAAQPVQNSPRTPTPAAQPVQNSPNTPKIAHFSPFYPSRENFVPPPPPRSRAGRTLYRTQHHPPVQNSPNTPKIAHFSPFCPSRENFVPLAPPRPQQGELCTAPSAKPGTKLSQRPRSTAVPRKSSPSTPHTTTEPRKSSPCTPKNGVFRLFRACRANFFAHKQATSHTGRIISRTGDRTGSADEGRMR